MSIKLIGDLNNEFISQNLVKLIKLLSGYNFIRYPNNQPTRIIKNFKNFRTDKLLVSKTHTLNYSFFDHSFVVAVLNLKPIKSGATLLNSRLITQDKLVKINEMIGSIPFGCIEIAETIEYIF